MKKTHSIAVETPRLRLGLAPLGRALGPFLWFGASPGEPLPDVSRYAIAKHTKGNAQGVKLDRPRLRVLPRSSFERLASIAEVADRLFGVPRSSAPYGSPGRANAPDQKA